MKLDMGVRIEPISDDKNKSDNQGDTAQPATTPRVESSTNPTESRESRMDLATPTAACGMKEAAPPNPSPVTEISSSDDAAAAAGIEMVQVADGERRNSASFWSSSEEGSAGKTPPDSGSSSSEESSGELEPDANAALATSSSPRLKTKTKRVHKPLGGKLSDESDDDHKDQHFKDGFDGLPDIFFQRGNHNAAAPHRSSLQMSHADIEICERLDMEYERALEEREIGYNARYQSVRQSACFSLFFMLVLLVAGVAFLTKVGGWNVRDSIFFSVYTMTTIGYGVPNSMADRDIFLIFTIFYIFIGIATLTVVVAQVYQCIALEASRAQHARDKAAMTRKGKDIMQQAGVTHLGMSDVVALTHGERFFDCTIRQYERLRICFQNSDVGRCVSVLIPFAGLIGIGAAVVGPIEGWSVTESIYFACVSLTTVGYGLYLPQNPISIYFCIFWLPCSVGFMSLFLGNVAAFYIRLSDKNILRLERQMRRRIKRAKEDAARQINESSKRLDMGTDDASAVEEAATARKPRQPKGFEMLAHDDPDSPLFGTPTADIGEMRRRHILANSNYSLEEPSVQQPVDQTMQTMRDVLRTIRFSMTTEHSEGDAVSRRSRQYLSMHSNETITSTTSGNLMRKPSIERKPTFALRVLVQERFAEIIATDIAGFQSHIEIKENTLSVTIDTLKETADKWLVPRRARRAFRAVAFEALYFVGEHGLITRGADALYDLSPFEFHGLFSPLLAAMGDAGTMEGWLANTDVLADVDLRRDGSRPSLGRHKQEVDAEFPTFHDGKGAEYKQQTTMGGAFT